jgi:hypothetical protein
LGGRLLSMNTLPEPPKDGLPMRWIRIIAILLTIAAVVVSVMREDPQVVQQRAVKPPTAGDFEAQWRRTVNTEIVRTFAAQKIEGCTEMAWRAHRMSHGQFLVYCTDNGGRRWTAWLVWPGAQRIAGPFPPDPLMPAPQ